MTASKAVAPAGCSQSGSNGSEVLGARTGDTIGRKQAANTAAIGQRTDAGGLARAA